MLKSPLHYGTQSIPGFWYSIQDVLNFPVALFVIVHHHENTLLGERLEKVYAHDKKENGHTFCQGWLMHWSTVARLPFFPGFWHLPSIHNTSKLKYWKMQTKNTSRCCGPGASLKVGNRYRWVGETHHCIEVLLLHFLNKHERGLWFYSLFYPLFSASRTKHEKKNVKITLGAERCGRLYKIARKYFMLR